MASLIAFRARHCIIDLTGFAVPVDRTQPAVTIDGIYITIANLLEKNIIPIIKFNAGANGIAYSYVVSKSLMGVTATPLKITVGNVITNTSASPNIG